MEGFYKGKREMVMKNEFQWERKGKSGACRHTGQFIKNGESFYLVVVFSAEFLKAYPKEGNFIIQKSVFDEILERHQGDGDAAVLEVVSRKQPTAKNRTPIDEEKSDKMWEILRRKGFYVHKETKDKLFFKHDRFDTSAGYVFCKRSLQIENKSRRNKGLFGAMAERELISRLREELLELPEGYRMKNAIDQATKTVQQMMGN